MTQNLKVTFELRVEDEQQFQDAVVVMTSAANTFFNKYRNEGDDATVRDYKCTGKREPHPLNLSQNGQTFCQKLKELYR